LTSISITVAVAILTFGSGLLGLFLQKRLPQTHLSGGSKDMILAVIGLLTLLLALILGTLGAISVASATFLILDLTQPYSDLFRVPASAIQQTLEAIDN
jgi:hypothetical protein